MFLIQKRLYFFLAGNVLKKRITCRGREFVGCEQELHYQKLNPKPSPLGPEYLRSTDNRIVKVKFIPPSIAKQRKHNFVGEDVSIISSLVTEVVDQYGDKPQHVGYIVSDLLHIDPKSRDKTTRMNMDAYRSIDWTLRERQYLTVYLIYRSGRQASYGLLFCWFFFCGLTACLCAVSKMLPQPMYAIGGYVIPPPQRRVKPFFMKPFEDHATAMLDEMYEMDETQWSDDDSTDEDEEMPTVIYGVCVL